MIDKTEIEKEISNRRIFSAVFTKKDGSERVMVGRLGVKKGLTGAGLKFSPAEKGLLGVYDMHNRGYKFINWNTLKRVRANGKEFE